MFPRVMRSPSIFQYFTLHLEYNKAKTSSVKEIYNINNRALVFKTDEPVQTLTWVLAGQNRKPTCSETSSRLGQLCPECHLGSNPRYVRPTQNSFNFKQVWLLKTREA